MSATNERYFFALYSENKFLIAFCFPGLLYFKKKFFSLRLMLTSEMKYFHLNVWSNSAKKEILNNQHLNVWSSSCRKQNTISFANEFATIISDSILLNLIDFRNFDEFSENGIIENSHEFILKLIGLVLFPFNRILNVGWNKNSFVPDNGIP